ncbi:hypothetical protein JMJ77_0010908, partial [Colletotrichum scovillei]
HGNQGVRASPLPLPAVRAGVIPFCPTKAAILEISITGGPPWTFGTWGVLNVAFLFALLPQLRLSSMPQSDKLQRHLCPLPV